MTLRCTMILGDCLEVMPFLPPQSTQMLFADLPYAHGTIGHTKNTWDRAFPAEELFCCLKPCLSDKSAIVFTCGDRLAADLVGLRPNLFRYSIIWEKPRASLYFHAKKRPLHAHETIQVFGRSPLTYNPQMIEGVPYFRPQINNKSSTQHETRRIPTINAGTRYPRSVVKFGFEDKPGKRNIHPTQKPVSLLDWLIRTYSNPGDSVLDPVSGSGTTAVAALSCGRNATCIEKDPAYFQASVERVRKHVRDNSIDATIEVRT